MRTARQTSPALLRERLTARWISPVFGTVAAAVETAAVVQPQLPEVARLPRVLQHRRQLHRLAELERRRHRRQADRHRLVLERLRRLAAAEVVVAVISPALQTLMAPLTLDSARWPAIRTACRRCNSGRRI